MRRLLLALVALFAACSEPPCTSGCIAPLDAASGDLGAEVAVEAIDRPPPDVGADAGFDVVDVVVVEESFAEIPGFDRPGVDVVDVQLGDVADAAAVGDVADVPGVEVAVDAGPMDVGAEVAAVGDVGSDTPDVVDVPRDAGPVVYDLEAVHAETSAVLLWGLACDVGCAGGVCDATTTPNDCHLASDGLHFGLDRCGTATGIVQLGTVGSIALGNGGIPAQATMFSTTRGARYTAGGSARANFHVQFSAPPSSSSAGATGVPGRTVSPTLGDIWLFGCTTP